MSQETPLVANLVANLQPSDILSIASQVALMLKPHTNRRKKSQNLKGLFKHSRTGLWYWRFTHGGKRYAVALATSDHDIAQASAMRHKAALYGTPERKTTPEEQNLYMASLQANRLAKTTEQNVTTKSVYTKEGFTEWYEAFNLSPGRHRNSTVRFAKNYIKLLLDGLGVSDVRKITPALLSRWRDKRLATAAKLGKANALRAATSVSTIYRNVRAAFEQAAKPLEQGGAGIFKSNPIGSWKPFSKTERKRLIAERERHLPPSRFTAVQIRTILEKANDYSSSGADSKDPVKIAATLAIWLMATAGLRYTETQFARWELVDWKRHLLKLEPSEHFTTKSGKARLVPLPTITIQKLADHKESAGFILPSPDKKDGLENSFDRVSVRPHLEIILKNAELGRALSPHGLRHAYVTLARESGISRDAIQAAVGHSSGLVTAIYDHSEPDAKAFDALPLESTKPKSK